MFDIQEILTNLTGFEKNSFLLSFLQGIIIITSVMTMYLFFHKFIFNFIKLKAMRSNFKFIKKMIRNGAIKKILWIINLSIMYFFSGSFSNETYRYIYDKILFISIIILSIKLIFNLIDMTVDKMERRASDGKDDQYFPIKPLFQIIKLVIFLISIIVAVAHSIDQTPIYILSGLTAISAVFMFIFKDVIQGFIAAFQVSLHRTVKVGDWIEVPKYSANGEVSEITLTLISVKNFDNTTTIIPTHALLTESFKNWERMLVEGRRIMRPINIDVSSIRHLTNEEIENLKKIKLIKNYIVAKQIEIEENNADIKNDEYHKINARYLSNIGTFRKYVEFYLRNNKDVKQDLRLVVRVKEDTGRGVPLEVYCFLAKTKLYQYEGIQSDLFEHLYLVMPLFGLRPFQEISSSDLVKINNISES